ncbi:ATP-binding protein [Roseateles sp. BYS78W]|uniref:histidine kinase n=1 Tax=Pelomonas candidula TaxID=3299025 RepID=A0ABW7H9Q7_9BURK
MTRTGRLLLLAWLLVSPAAQAGEVFSQRYEQADHQTAAIVEEAQPLQAPQDAPWQPVALPDRRQRPLGESAEMDQQRAMHWYRLRWTMPAGLAADAPLAVYVPRVTGEAVTLWLREPQGWRQVFDNQAGIAEQWNRPLLMTLPPQRRASGEVLTLALGLPSRYGGFYALSTVWAGPEEELRDRHGLRSALQQTVPAAVSLAMLAMGLLSFVVWLGRRAERAYLYFACAAAGWTLRNLHFFVILPSGDLAYAWFWWMTSASVAWLMLATYLFAFRFDARRLPRVERGLALFVLAGSLLTVPGLPVSLLVQHAVTLVAALTVTGVLTALAVRGGRRELRVIVVALWIGLGLAVHDWLLVGVRISPESIYLLPYGALLMIGSFLYAALRRFTGAIEQAESASALLSARLAEREAELAARHEQLRTVEREQALLLERQRLMRDMHDGVGSTLIAMLRLAESGTASAPAMAELLRSAIEDLRLTIDSLEPLEHDLATLLATLRTRVGHRLHSAGLNLEWAMADMPPLPWLEPAQALQVLRLIQEAMTNVIKHARARTLSLSARQEGSALEVRIEDDGCGFDATLPGSGHGLASMRQRAQVLGATLRIDTTPGRGTLVVLRLPLRA